MRCMPGFPSAITPPKAKHFKTRKPRLIASYARSTEQKRSTALKLRIPRAIRRRRRIGSKAFGATKPVLVPERQPSQIHRLIGRQSSCPNVEASSEEVAESGHSSLEQYQQYSAVLQMVSMPPDQPLKSLCHKCHAEMIYVTHCRIRARLKK
jgi:hypothetical protein